MINEEKITIIERLLEAKQITFREALKLIETEKEYIYYPPVSIPFVQTQPLDVQPWTVTYETNDIAGN